MPAQRLLDQVHSLAAIDALAAEPGRYAAELGAELPGAATLTELEARDAQLVAALGQLDALAARVMRIHLDHALAADTSIAAPTRRVFAQTIVGYAHDLGLLEQRARDVAARGRAPDPDATALLVVDAARATLALWAALRDGVLALIRTLAAAAAAEADGHARDRTRPDLERRRWSAARRDLEALASDPARITTAPMPARLAALPEQLDEPAAQPELTFADMIELD